jgi:hypothetical protein
MRGTPPLILPPVRQELGELGVRRLGNVGQDGSQVRLGIDVMTFGAGDKRIQQSGGGASAIVAGKEPVLAADGSA